MAAKPADIGSKRLIVALEVETLAEFQAYLPSNGVVSSNGQTA